MDPHLVSRSNPPSWREPAWCVRGLPSIPLAAGLLLLCGCSLMPWRRGPEPVPTPRTSADEAPAPLKPASPPSRPPDSQPRERPAAVADTTTAASKPAEPSPPETVEPGITIQLTEEERTRLVDETEKDVALITACLGRLDAGRMDEEQRRSLTDIQDLLKAVMKAREEADVQAASRLARKARLLAEDLAAQ